MSRPATAALLALLLTAIASLARADSRVEFLADRLRFPPAAGQADDFRVRTSAALALGATNDDGAVVPLCGGLSDPSEVVRQAAAVALKRLGRPSELDCLRRRVGVETSSSVKAEIQRAIDAIDASGGGGGSSGNGGAGPPVVANARYYVALSSVTNNTSRATGDIERVVKDAITSKLAQLGEYQLAPAGESNGVAKAAIAKRKLKGYYLGISVEKFDYSDGNLRVRVRIAVFSYPGRDLRGEVPAGATLPGARPGDKGAEDQLLSVVAGQATDLFAQNFK
ncbi:MAG: HEAT repeat domain-containing protein [Polyangiaceae bacterium]